MTRASRSSSFASTNSARACRARPRCRSGREARRRAPRSPKQEPRLEERGADRHVRLRLADAVVDRARRVADLELQVPQHIEHRLDDALAPGGLLVGQQEQEIDVGPRRQRAAPVAAGRDNGELLGRGGVVGRVEVPHDAVVQGAHDAVHEAGEPARAGEPVALAQERRLGFGAALVEDAAQLGNEPSAQARRIAQAFAVEPFGKAREPQRRLIQGVAHPVGLAHPGRPISLRHRRGCCPSSSGFCPVIVGVLARHRRGRCPSSPGRRRRRRRLRSRTPRPFVITN